jgi:hypothetical protein
VRTAGIGRAAGRLRLARWNGVKTVNGVPLRVSTAPGAPAAGRESGAPPNPAARSVPSTASSRVRSDGSYSSFQYTASASAARAARITVSFASP